MKKTLLGMAISAFFVMGAAQAASDTPATLTITGTVTAEAAACAVKLDTTTVSLTGESTDLIAQDAKATAAATEIKLGLESSDGSNACADLVAANQINFKFSGVAEGTSLKNTLASETAAKGVAVGIYDADNNVVSVGSTLPGTADKFKLQLVKVDNVETTAGDINSSLTVEINRL